MIVVLLHVLMYDCCIALIVDLLTSM
jgi:hypothetical protein